MEIMGIAVEEERCRLQEASLLYALSSRKAGAGGRV